MSKRTVWVAEAGEYSDRHVVAVFSDKETAKKHSNLWDDLSEFFLDYPESGPQYITVDMLEDGSVLKLERHVLAGPITFSAHKWVWAPPWARLAGSMWALRVWVRTNDEKRATKVANDKRSAILASNGWGEDRALALL